MMEYTERFVYNLALFSDRCIKLKTSVDNFSYQAGPITDNVSRSLEQYLESVAKSVAEYVDSISDSGDIVCYPDITIKDGLWRVHILFDVEET